MIAVRTSEATASGRSTEGAEPGEHPFHARRVARRKSEGFLVD